MAVTEFGWLITSDVAHEVAFRVDVPEENRGRWVLSYLPTSRRLTRDQAVAGVVLAEMILLGLLRPGGEFDGEVAALHAGMIGLTVTDAMCLLALRDNGSERSGDPAQDARQLRRPVERCHLPPSRDRRPLPSH
ncbi:hypothetical protein ACWDUL_12310 [Nocardia niigatensis]|uniref:hypothetical protein n=1 Tax=Nocardia niigatensis TaxID=209249 RepID=UPI00031D2F06|nr:hypothetical protein [Nocardia niigatensis]